MPWNPENDITCPFCYGRQQTCCHCRSTGRMSLANAARRLAWVWEAAGCSCMTCGTLRKQRRAAMTEGERRAEDNNKRKAAV